MDLRKASHWLTLHWRCQLLGLWAQLGNKSQIALKKKGIKCQLVLSLCGSLNLYVKGHTSLVWGEKHAIESIFLKKPSWVPVLECRGQCMRDWRSVFDDWVEHKLFRFFRFVSSFSHHGQGQRNKGASMYTSGKMWQVKVEERSSSVPL